MSQMNLQQLFPQLLKLLLNPIPVSEFAALPYFSRYFTILSEKQCKSKAQKSHKCFKLVKVKKGTVIYNCEDTAQKGYIILNGTVRILKKKSGRQKTQSFPNHMLHNDEQKCNFLFQNFKIPKAKAEQLLTMFYQQKIMFKFLPFHTLLNNEEFGFGEMLRNTNRTHTAIALQDTQMLVIEKKDFDEYLRDFQQKKQTALIRKLLSGCREQMAEQMMPKMASVMNTALLLNYDNQQLVYSQSQFPTDIFFIVEGEVEVRKKVTLAVPKKFMKHEILEPIQKEVTIKVCRNEKGSFFGEEEIFSGRKTRNNAVSCILNNSLILKIDHCVFLKSIGDFIGYQKMLIQNAVYKKSLADASYEKQYKKAFSSFISQYEAYDNRKKEKMLSNFVNQSQKKNILFEAFAPTGIFFRDTFQKLEGFQEAEKSPNKSQSIKRFKQKSTHMESTTKGGPRQTESPKIESKDEYSIAQKMLFSPKKSANMAEFYTQALNSATNQSAINTPQSHKKSMEKNPQKLAISKKRSTGKFQQIEKDEQVYKRVLIKNGLFPIDRTTNKSNSVKALVHHNFDQVIKQCISRKNQNLKRTSKQKQNQIIIDSFQRSVQSLKNKSFTSNSLRLSRFTAPCKGTQELKKRMQSIQNLGSGRFSELGQTRKRSVITKIEDCIGVNEKPKSSQISMRNTFVERMSAYPSHQRSPEKIVLLNHMMKPITYYNSTQI